MVPIDMNAVVSVPVPGCRQDLLIHGVRVPAASGRYFPTVDPASEQLIAEVAEG